MFSMRREFFFFLVIIATLTKYECRGQSEEESKNDNDKLVTTYRTICERKLQFLLGLFSHDSSSSTETETSTMTSTSLTERETSTMTSTSPTATSTSEISMGRGIIGGIRGLIDKLITKRVKKIIQPFYNTTAKSFGEVLNLVEGPFHAIYPGTLWCGGGDIANSEGNTGLFEKTDSCCRAHDKCPTIIEAGKSSGRLLNNGAFTRLICDCDHAFYTCLKNVGSPLSMKIGKTYFNVLRPQCFDLKQPIKRCEKYGSFLSLLNRRCRKYQFDETQPKKLTWLDNWDF